jgi:hypothetical protein
MCCACAVVLYGALCMTKYHGADSSLTVASYLQLYLQLINACRHFTVSHRFGQGRIWQTHWPVL